MAGVDLGNIDFSGVDRAVVAERARRGLESQTGTLQSGKYQWWDANLAAYPRTWDEAKQILVTDYGMPEAEANKAVRFARSGQTAVVAGAGHAISTPRNLLQYVDETYQQMMEKGQNSIRTVDSTGNNLDFHIALLPQHKGPVPHPDVVADRRQQAGTAAQATGTALTQRAEEARRFAGGLATNVPTRATQPALTQRGGVEDTRRFAEALARNVPTTPTLPTTRIPNPPVVTRVTPLQETGTRNTAQFAAANEAIARRRANR